MAIQFTDTYGTAWGWIWPVPPQIFLQPVDRTSRFGPLRDVRVLLEENGHRIFRAAGKVPRHRLAELRRRVEADRVEIEDAWVTVSMMNGRWLTVRVRGPHVILTAYPGLPTSFTRTIDARNLVSDHDGGARHTRVLVKEVVCEPDESTMTIRVETPQVEEFTFFLPDLLFLP